MSWISKHSAETTGSPGADDGFTLIELLVAIALLALLTASTAGVIRIARYAWQNAAVADQTLFDQSVLTFLRHRLAETPALREKSRDGMSTMVFQGRARQVRFAATMLDGPQGAGLFVFEVLPRDPSLDRSPLILRWRPFSVANDGDVVPSERQLLPDYSAVSFRYYGYNLAARQREWMDEWLDPQSLPEAVEIITETFGQKPRRSSHIVTMVARNEP